MHRMCHWGLSDVSVFPQFVMELSFSEAAKGASKELSVNIDDNCPRCDGKGSEPGTKVSQCNYCNGTGMVSFRLAGRSRALKPVVWGRISLCCSSATLMTVSLPAGDSQHGSFHDAQLLSTLRWEGNDHYYGLRHVSRLRSDQEEADGHCACTCW